MKVKYIDFIKNFRQFLYPYFFLLAVCIFLMLVFTKKELYFTVNQVHTVFADVFFTYVTQLGSSRGCIAIAILLILINFRKGFLLASSYILTFIISQTIKHLVNAPRPHLFFAKKLNGIYLVKGVVMLDKDSFPSGHSVSAFTAAVVLTYFAKGKFTALVVLVLAVLVAYSRLYLSEHFLEDVTTGSAIGVFITTFWLYWINQQPFLQNENWNKGIFGRKKSEDDSSKSS